VRSRFRDLRAYSLAFELGGRLHRSILDWPAFERWTVGRQLMRAVDSIGANIAEGSGRLHHADRRHFFVVARGSLLETEHWLACAGDRGLPADAPDELLTEIARTLSGLINRYAPR
jgi:four helix bundle protein